VVMRQDTFIRFACYVWRGMSTGPEGLQEAKAPIFQDSRLMKLVRLSALRTSHLYPQEIFLLEAYSTPGP
jgi:hypothetical protein